MGKPYKSKAKINRSILRYTMVDGYNVIVIFFIVFIVMFCVYVIFTAMDSALAIVAALCTSAQLRNGMTAGHQPNLPQKGSSSFMSKRVYSSNNVIYCNIYN